MLTLGQLLKKFRTNDVKITLTELADLTGLSQPYLSMVENDKKFPSIQTFFKIIEALSIKGKEIEHYRYKNIEKKAANRYAWINYFFNEFLKNFGELHSDHSWSPSENIKDPRLEEMVEVVANYFPLHQQGKDGKIFLPSERYAEQEEMSINNEKKEGDLNFLLRLLPYNLDLKIIDYNNPSFKNLSLFLDDRPLSNTELNSIITTINGIRYSRLH